MSAAAPTTPTSWADRLALALSVVLSPFVCVPYFCVVLARATARSHHEFVTLAWLCTALSIGVPAAYICWHVYRGTITDLHVKLREQRRGPFRAGMVGMGTLFAALWLADAPVRLTALAGVLFAQVFLFEYISRFWKISMHTSVLAACLGGCVELAGWSPASMWVIAPLSWARAHRGRHHWTQGLGGGVLGYLLTVGPLSWMFPEL